MQKTFLNDRLLAVLHSSRYSVNREVIKDAQGSEKHASEVKAFPTSASAFAK